MSNNDIDIVFVTDKKIFDSNYINNLKQIGNVIFCSRENFITKIISNKNKKIIVYDPDFVRQTFPQEILTQSKNVLAIFLGITDDYYIDLEAYDKGLITTPCGVLAEDTIWNMLEKLRDEKVKLKNIKYSNSSPCRCR